MGFFGFTKGSDENNSELPDIFPLSVIKTDFMRTDIMSTYVKILTDTFERTFGISKDKEPLLWDNCVQSESNEGLVSLLANAMTDSKDLFLVYRPSVNVVRKATQEEQREIEKDYTKDGESKVGVYVSFRKYRKTEMLYIYSALEYCILSSLNKTLNISKAVQIKISELRSSISLVDADIAKAQGKNMAIALSNGKDVMMDVKDEITTATPDTSSTEKAIVFLDAKRAFILGLPVSYISGVQTPGIGSTGEADMRAVERGLKLYYVSIVRPVLKALFGIDTEFKSQDFRQITTALEVLKTFDLVSDENMSVASKQEIIARVFELDQKQEEKNLEKESKEREKVIESTQGKNQPNEEK